MRSFCKRNKNGVHGWKSPISMSRFTQRYQCCQLGLLDQNLVIPASSNLFLCLLPLSLELQCSNTDTEGHLPSTATILTCTKEQPRQEYQAFSPMTYCLCSQTPCKSVSLKNVTNRPKRSHFNCCLSKVSEWCWRPLQLPSALTEHPHCLAVPTTSVVWEGASESHSCLPKGKGWCSRRVTS